jgi:ABC-2 type transport system ATP-binding protein
MLLAAEAISKHFGSNPVLRDVSFSVRRGEVLGLIGPNGSGKTTLFECLAGLIPAGSGQVRFDGRVLAPAHRKKVLFYLPDAIRPWADQTVKWLIGFFGALYGRPKADGAALASALALSDLMGSRVGALSKGELKRTLLALALLTPHPLLLLDEPFDGLDYRQTRDVMALLRTWPGLEGRTLFLSIHQLSDAARMCDRFVLLSRGRSVGEGTLEDLCARAGLTEGGLEEIFLALT